MDRGAGRGKDGLSHPAQAVRVCTQALRRAAASCRGRSGDPLLRARRLRAGA